jgi:hypothetical protein
MGAPDAYHSAAMKTALVAANYLLLASWGVIAVLLLGNGTLSSLTFVLVMVVGATLSRFSFTRLHRIARSRWPESYSAADDT